MIQKQTQSFKSSRIRREFLAMSICLVFFTSMVMGIQAIQSQTSMKATSPTDEQEIVNQLIHDTINELEEEPNLASMIDSEELPNPPTYSADLDLGSVLADRENEYGEIFEPWKSKAAIHAIKYDESTGFLALGGGYLYDNEVHVYRLNVETGKFDKVWECGDSVIQGDVMALAFGDTDLNDFMEIIAGSSDGHIYVFEQRHIYDPYTNTENMFDLVWVSPYYFRVFDVKVEDVDRDYRPDIIAGTWNGLHLFEYDEHSGYPFVEDHWITYRHVWDAQELSNTKIYSLETGDTNENGLPEIIVGTRDGTVYVYENAGLSVIINGYPFPLIRDNYYHQIWSSENYTWTPILDMALGELDGTLGDELAIIAQGQGLLTLQWNNSTNTYDYRKVVKAYEPWETFGPWGLDRWVDRVISANNVTYHDQLNASINVPEPIIYTDNGVMFIPDADVYPYNTGMAMAVDGNYTTFDSTIPGVTNATAIVDFGLDEEGTGSASADPDVIVTFRFNINNAVFPHINFSISKDGTDFEQVDSSHFTTNLKELRIDVDSALGKRKWDWFRYAKISVFGSVKYEINAMELKQVYNLLTDTLSVTIGPMRLDGDNYFPDLLELDKIIVGTSIGKYIVVGWQDTTETYEILWDSGADERFASGTGVWDLEYITSQTDVPIWRMLYPPYPQFIWPQLDISVGPYNSWTYGFIDPIGLTGPGHYFVGTKNGNVQAFDIYGNADPTVNSYIADISGDYGSKITLSLEVAPIPGTTFNNLPMIAVASYDPTINITEHILDTPRAKLRFYYRNTFSLTAPFSLFYDLDDEDHTFDPTGDIGYLFAVAKVPPKMKFYDFDEDGDLDFAFTNGQLYLARNMQMEDGGLPTTPIRFLLVRDYFSDVNAKLTSGGWGQPDTYDLNGDDIWDLTLNYAHKNGTTAFINKGSNLLPVWEEDKRIFWNWDYEGEDITNIKLLNLTDTRILPVKRSSLEVYGNFFNFEMNEDFVMVSFNKKSNMTWWAEPVYDAIDSYLVATYPEVKWIDFSLMHSTDFDFWNLGFHVREAWSTKSDLEDWTLSISSGDLDQDGKGEIIVGDYDNNVYVFENLVNNTYKRMYRTFDLNYTIATSESPYLYEELEGISGEFIRTVWEHAEFLVADVDLDQDNRKELLIGSGPQIFVFEDMKLTGGDQLRFVCVLDLRKAPFFKDLEGELDAHITALTTGNDLDYDLRDEIIVAAGNVLMIFNVDKTNYSKTIENEYFVTNLSLEGRYDLVGNPFGISDHNQFAQINALISGDTDQDSYKEIILGGNYDTRYIKDNGFVYIYECQAGTFYKAWEAPTTLTEWNPVNDLAIDDQDYDGAYEIIIGHHYGIDIWEYIPGTDSNYQRAEYITDSPNYPHIPVSTFSLHITSNLEQDRAYSDMANGKDISDDIIMYATVNYTRLTYILYDEVSQAWISSGRITPVAGYGGYTDANIYIETMPSIMAHSNGGFYAVWKMIPGSGSLPDYANARIYASYYNPTTELWSTPLAQTNAVSTDQVFYPDIAEYNTTHVVIFLTWDQSSTGGLSRIAYRIRPNNLAGAFGLLVQIQFPGYNAVKVHSSSVQRHSDGSYTIVFSAVNNLVSKPDYDIWSMHLDSILNFTKTNLNQVTSSYDDELFPNLALLESPEESLVVIYERAQLPYEDRLGVSSSQDYGRNWGRINTLNVLPSFIHRVEYPEYQVVQYEDAGGTIYPLFSFFGACIAPLNDEGFIYTFQVGYPAAGYQTGDLTWIWYSYNFYGKNLQSDWTGNHLHDVVDLDVGDTDGDQCREIAAGWDHQVGVYEMKSSTNGAGIMTYEEAWLSTPFAQPFTGITVYDSNGNCFEELGIATERGDVFVYEFPNPSIGTSPLLESELQWNTSVGDYGIKYASANVDINGDGREEIFFGSHTGGVYALNDLGTILWQVDIATGRVYFLDVVNLTNSGTWVVLLTTYDGTLLALNATSGATLWSKAAGGTVIYMNFDVGDLTSDPGNEIVIGSTNGTISVFKADGTKITQIAFPGQKIWRVRLGEFRTANETLLAFSVDSQRIRIVYPINGTLIYESPAGVIGSYWLINNLNNGPLSDILAYDIDGDFNEEVIFMDELLRVLDVETQTIIFNSSYHGIPWYELFIRDVDDDGSLEVITLTLDNGIFVEDLKAQSTQWHYHPSDSTIYDSALGIYANGQASIAVTILVGTATVPSVLVEIDAATGIPKWIHISGGQISLVETSSNMLTGDLTFIGWNFDQLCFEAIQGKTPSPRPHPPSITHHPEYYSMTTNGEVDKMWVEDITQDGVDDLIWLEDQNHLIMWDTQEEKVIHDIKGIEVRDIQFGNFDNKGYRDFAVFNYDGTVTMVDGSNLDKIVTISPPTNFHVNQILVGNFNNGYAYDEVAILFEQYAPEVGFIQWYSNVGDPKYRTLVNASKDLNYMFLGRFTGDASHLDIMLYVDITGFWIYHGDTGVRQWTYGYSTAIADIVTGDFNKDGFDDFAFLNYNYDILAFKLEAGGINFLFGPILFEFGEVREIISGDIANDDGRDELIVNNIYQGIIAYDESGSEVWRFNAPLMMDWAILMPPNPDPKTQSCNVAVADYDNDGDMDLALTNHNYINVINTSTPGGRILWHYQGEGHLNFWQPAAIHGMNKNLGFVYEIDSKFVFVSGYTKVIKSMGEGNPAVNLTFPILQTGIVALTIGIPVIIFGVAVFQVRKKKPQKSSLH